jgi:hypothetical protein
MRLGTRRVNDMVGRRLALIERFLLLGTMLFSFALALVGNLSLLSRGDDRAVLLVGERGYF